MHPDDLAEKMSKKVGLRDWFTPVKAATIVFAGICAMIGLIDIKPLSKLSHNNKTTLLKLSYVSIKNLHQPNFANKQPSIYNLR